MASIYRHRPEALSSLDRWVRSLKTRRAWDAEWSRADYAPHWLGRGISPEILRAVSDGWFRPGVHALDIGCGEGDVAAWLSAHGFPCIGFDISPAAIARARRRFPEIEGTLKFLVHDLCLAPLPLTLPCGALIDRGCFHQIHPNDRNAYVRNMARMAAPEGARLLMFVKAFRGGIAYGDPAEIDRITAEVSVAMTGHFNIIRTTLTYLDKDYRTEGGIVFWLETT